MPQPLPRLIDLSPPLADGMPVYPGDPPVARTWHLTLERDGVNVSRLELGAHAGSHVDAPLHFLAGGADVARMPLDLFYGPALALDAPAGPGRDLDPGALAGAEIRPGDIVIFRSGWEARWGTPAYYGEPWPGLSAALVEALLARGVKAVGMDMPSADSPAAIQAGVPAHRLLLEAGLPVFECLVNLREVLGRRFVFAGFPLKIAEGEASPLRAVAIL